MADADELRQMVLSFRCSELQVLLGFAGRNKTGRKQELQSRALELLRLRSTPIQMKIKELHKRRYPVLPNSPKPSYGSNTISNLSSASTSAMKSSQYSSHSVNNAQGIPGTSVAYPTGAPLDFSSKHVLQQPHHSSSSNYPVHPDVRFKRLPFYDVLGELLKPASLVPSGSSRFQENNFVFHLTPQQAHDIAISRDVRPGVKQEYSVQVQLRFCLLETSCDQEDNFPPSICVKVNSKLCPLPNPIPTNKPGVEPKRPSRPVNVTALCRLSPTVSNHINVSWASEFGRGYAVAVYLVKRLSSVVLLQRLKSQGVRNADHTRAMIKEKLAHDADSEIATTSLRVSLMCPLGKMRMQCPCRASTCGHLQCFDASLYLQMNEKKPTWICPVCDKAAPFDSLVLDGLFLEIFNAAPESNEIQFHEDGSWSPLMPKKESQTIGSPVSSKSVPVVTPPSQSATPSAPPSKTDKSKYEVIDLTLDESSDDEDLGKAQPSSKSGHHALQGASSHMDSKMAACGMNSSSVPGAASSSATSGHTNTVGSVSPHIITLDSPPRPSSSSSPSFSTPSPQCSSSSSSFFYYGGSAGGGGGHHSSSRPPSVEATRENYRRLLRIAPEFNRMFSDSDLDSSSNSADLRAHRTSLSSRLARTDIVSNPSSSAFANPTVDQAEISLEEVLQLGFIDRNPAGSVSGIGGGGYMISGSSSSSSSRHLPNPILQRQDSNSSSSPSFSISLEDFFPS